MSIHHFPVWLSRFIGREKEIAEIQNQLSRARLLTLTGPGGSGKTRLVQEVVHAVCEPFHDGAWYIDLASVQDGSLVPQTVFFALGLSEIPGQTIIARLVDYLQSKCLLLVFDNCEHVVEQSAKLSHTLLAVCPELRILATSREPLQIAGEMVVQVPPLTLPGGGEEVSLDTLLRSEAGQLFAERARLVSPAFAINQHNVAEVVDICRAVDGIPLALEIAAARVSALPLAEIARRISEAGQRWAVSNRLAPTRQQTMQATLDWSYDLLEAEEQRLFWRLSVFAGGFDLPAAAAVCVGNGIEQENIPWLLSRLVDKSLVVYKPERDPGSASRYRMLEVIHQYGLDRLKRSGEDELLRERHFDWCLALVRQANFFGEKRGHWIKQIDQELPNLRQAFIWGKAEASRWEQVYPMAARLGQFFQSRGYFQEGLEWSQSLLSPPFPVSNQVLADAHFGAAFITMHMYDFDRSEKYLHEAIRLFQEIGDQKSAAVMVNFLGTGALQKGNYRQAQSYSQESLAMLEKLDSMKEIGIALMLAGDLAFLSGEYHRASAIYEKSTEICKKTGNLMAVARRQVRLAQVRTALGDLERAHKLLEECLKENRGNGDRWITAMIALCVASITAARGWWIQAAQCLGITQVFKESFGTRLWTVDQSIFEDLYRLVGDRLGGAAFSAALEEGRRVGSEPEQVEQLVSRLLEEWLVSPAPVPSRGSKQALTPKQAARQVYDGLTEREREVAVLIAQGKNNAEIAASLYLAVRTVEMHVTKILTKLGYSSRTQIAVWAAGKGLGIHK